MTRGRILFVTSTYPRWKGDSTPAFISHLAQDLTRLGWIVDVLAPHAPGALYRETLDGIAVRRFRYLWPASLQTVCYRGGALINLRKRPLDKLKIPALVAMECLAVLRSLLDGRYDLMHTHWILPQGLVGVLAAAIRPLPHVTTVHGGDVFALRGRLPSRLKSLVLQRADAVTVNSSATESAVITLAPGLTHMRRIPLGVSLDRPIATTSSAEIAARYRRGAGPLIIFTGRLVSEKGVEDLIRAVALLRERLPETHALILGEGQDRAALQGLTHELGVADCVTFMGWVQPDDVPAYLAAADVFVGPSRSSPEGWIEALGLSLLEAMAAAVPVVASRVGGIIDFVSHEETGLLVHPQAPQEIADAVYRLATQPELAHRIRLAAAQRVRQHYSRPAAAESFSRLYAELLNSHRPLRGIDSDPYPR